MIQSCSNSALCSLSAALPCSWSASAGSVVELKVEQYGLYLMFVVPLAVDLDQTLEELKIFYSTFIAEGLCFGPSDHFSIEVLACILP